MSLQCVQSNLQLEMEKIANDKLKQHLWKQGVCKTIRSNSGLFFSLLKLDVEFWCKEKSNLRNPTYPLPDSSWD